MELTTVPTEGLSGDLLATGRGGQPATATSPHSPQDQRDLAPSAPTHLPPLSLVFTPATLAII